MVDNEVLYEFNTKNGFKVNLIVCSAAIVAWINLVIWFCLVVKVGLCRGTFIALGICACAIYDMTPELIKLFPSIKKKDIREYDAVVTGLVDANTVVFRYLDDGNGYCENYFAPGVDNEIINTLFKSGEGCRIKVNSETRVLIEMKCTPEVNFAKERENKMSFESLKYSDISSEVWYAYGGIAEVTFFIVAALVCAYAQISGYDRMGIFLGWSVIFYIVEDYKDMIKSLKYSFDVKKTKDAKCINKTGKIVDTIMIENAYAKLKKVQYRDRDCIELSIVENTPQICKYYIYVKDGEFFNIWRMSNMNRKIKFKFFEGTNIVRKIETID